MKTRRLVRDWTELSIDPVVDRWPALLTSPSVGWITVSCIRMSACPFTHPDIVQLDTELELCTNNKETRSLARKYCEEAKTLICVQSVLRDSKSLIA